MSDIGKRIKDERIAKKMSQQELADMLGLKQHTISQYETDIIRPSYEVLVQIANILNVTTDYLLGREKF